jgi:hypothetical protein
LLDNLLFKTVKQGYLVQRLQIVYFDAEKRQTLMEKYEDWRPQNKWGM